MFLLFFLRSSFFGWSPCCSIPSDYWKLNNVARCKNLAFFIVVCVEDTCCLWYFFHSFQRQVISRIQWKKWNWPEDTVEVKVIVCLGFNNKAVEIWSIAGFFYTSGNHGVSRVSYIRSLWEGKTLEILLLKSDLSLVLTHESWRGAFCQHSLLSSEPEKPVSAWLLVLPPLLEDSIVTVEFFWNHFKIVACAQEHSNDIFVTGIFWTYYWYPALYKITFGTT